MKPDLIVVGAGPIGSAAARHAQLAGLQTVLFTGRELGISSHDDDARVQSMRGRDPRWEAWNRASLAAWPRLEAETGVRFHHPVGCLHGSGTLGPWGESGELEPAPAGTIAPRALVRAQREAFARAGGHVRDDVVRRIHPGAVQTDHERLACGHVLVAAGALSRFLVGTPLVLESETVMRVEVPGPLPLPALLHDVRTDSYEGVYATPPLADADGRWWLKLGANFPDDHRFDTEASLRAWFTDGDSERHRAVLTSLLETLLPGLSPLRTELKRCVLSRTRSGHPSIERIAPRLSVATGGNGYAAMASDGIGAEAAREVQAR